MTIAFDLFTPFERPADPGLRRDRTFQVARRMTHLQREAETTATSVATLSVAGVRYLQRVNEVHLARRHAAQQAGRKVFRVTPAFLFSDRLVPAWSRYIRDAGERAILTWDRLRKRGDATRSGGLPARAGL